MKFNIKHTATGKISEADIENILLRNRGIENEAEFLNPPYPKDITFESFFPNKKVYRRDFQKTIDLLNFIYKKGKTIVVYTDYDADGITGGAILWETLHILGFKVMPYVPHRKTEGYGFSKKGIDAVKKQFNPALIISVDHGIVSHDKISYAKSLNIPIIITDHHQKLDKNHEDAHAVFHTDQLSGSGVAYFFAKEVFNRFATVNKSTTEKLASLFSSDYLALASIGTVADLVPLVGPSRSVVKYGLEAFSSAKRVGLKQILQEARVKNRKMTPYEIGFIIAPRINAFGRLEHALDALRLLCTTNPQKAGLLAKKAGVINTVRQNLVKEATQQAERMVDVADKIIVLKSNAWEEGIIGLIASKLVEKFGRPAIVMTQADGFFKASVRSIPGFDVTAFLKGFRKYLVDVGGHAQAAGFTIEAGKVDIFIDKVREKAAKILTDEDFIRTLDIDAALPLSMVTLVLCKRLEALEPFGIGNPKPLILSRGQVVDARRLGKDNSHLKIVIKDKTSNNVEFIAFNEGNKFHKLTRGQTIQIVYSPEVNRWNDRETVQGNVKNIDF